MTTTTDNTALATREYPKLAELTGMSSAQINLIRATVVPPDTSDLELAWFLYNSRRLDLEPTLDQIYAIRYSKGDPIEIVIGINGYRKQADDSGAYAGSDDPEFDYGDEDLAKRGWPTKASVTVWKIVQGQRVPFTASARWKEFYPGDGPIGAQYRKRPHNQLAIRAESHALRKAFPYQTSRLEPQPAPGVWVQAVEADITAQHSPQRQTALAGQYRRIYGSENTRTAYDLKPPRTVDVGTGEVLDQEKGERPTEQEVREESVGSEPRSEPSGSAGDSNFQRLQELLKMAKRRKLRMDQQPAPGDGIEAAIAYWDARIAQHDEQAELERQRAQEGVR